MKRLLWIFPVMLAVTLSAPGVRAQMQTRTNPQATPTPTPSGSKETLKQGGKKNERPVNGNGPAAPKKENQPTYFYEFTQPNFVLSKILVQHDEAGRGKVMFMKQGFDELITEEMQLSAATLERIQAALGALNFFDSTENYQYEKDYSHLGNVTIRIQKGGKEREIKFNYTENKDAKALADEYRRIGQQFIWMFDVNVSRENQPLEAPQLMDLLDSYLKRSEISDPSQLLPFLKELANDERIPLIARNHAARIVKSIEKLK